MARSSSCTSQQHANTGITSSAGQMPCGSHVKWFFVHRISNEIGPYGSATKWLDVQASPTSDMQTQVPQAQLGKCPAAALPAAAMQSGSSCTGLEMESDPVPVPQNGSKFKLHQQDTCKHVQHVHNAFSKRSSS